MQPFMNEDFLLSTPTAKTLYHDYAKTMPIVDYHCHVSPREIAENKRFDNLTQVWLGGDHYKWRIMRWHGVDEKYITGDGTDREKFDAFARTLPYAIGNPLYHWTHLELKRYFGCDLLLSPATADEIWEICNQKLQTGALTVRDIIKQSKVTFICTTDDPVDTLEWHKAMAEDKSWDVEVLPAFRPDKAVNADKADFAAYINKLAAVSGKPIAGMADLYAALSGRLDFFDSMGCRAADHGLDYVVWQPATDAEVDAVFVKALKGHPLTAAELDGYKTAMMRFFGREYARRGWVMQLHYGAQRSVNPTMLAQLGPDTGYDCVSARDCSAGLTGFLGALSREELLPKTILYSLNPNDDALLASVAGCFEGGVRGKVQHGSSWWFNDTKTGIQAQLVNLANLGVLGDFVGMLTDSRSFLSYTRHEYFRRILCDVLGSWVENGEYPADMATLGTMVQDISYNNAVRYFGFRK